MKSKFAEGDRVVADPHGLGRIGPTRVDKGETYVAVKLDVGKTLFLPAAKLDESVRALMSKAEAERLLSELRAPPEPLDARRLDERVVDAKRALVKGSAPERARALRALYGSKYRLSRAEQRLVAMFEMALLAEIAEVVGVPAERLGRELHAAYPAFAEAAPSRPEEPPPAAPKPPIVVPGYEYLGAFQLEGERLAIGDPPYTRSRNDPAKTTVAGARRNTLVSAKKGRWHGFIHPGAEGRPGALFAVHEERLKTFVRDAAKLRPIAQLRVDGGQMAVVDAAVRDDESYQDAMSFRMSSNGLVRDRGCMSESGFGDGVYVASALTEGGVALIVGVDFAAEGVPPGLKNAPPGTQLGRH
ncbi:MAG: CarD family transcriptional regulator [Polyangiaceae bacterium]|nr:CarD family transcriptional regulator [Polyangiaceae bacterium]